MRDAGGAAARGRNRGLEAAGRREVLEEAGVAVELVRLVSSQPWPRGRGGGSLL